MFTKYYIALKIELNIYYKCRSKIEQELHQYCILLLRIYLTTR